MREAVRKAGQRLMVGFEGHEPSADVRVLIRDYGVGHVILFARNVAEPEQVAGLVRELQEIAKDAGHDLPLFVAVDQEGGRVARLKAPWTVWPPLRAVGRIGTEEHAQRLGQALAAELRACGIRWDMAPVVDVDTNPKNPVIGDRAFSDDPDLVGRLGAALIRGLEGSGVAACAKHFPGHGDTDLDSHLELPVVSQSRSRLEDVEMRPFRSAVAAGVAGVMTAHVMFPEIDERFPATLSPGILALLRDGMKYGGVIVSRRPRDEGGGEDLELLRGDRARRGRRVRPHRGLQDAGCPGGGRGGPGAHRGSGPRAARGRARCERPHSPAEGALPPAVRRSRSQGGAPGRGGGRAQGPRPGDRGAQRHSGLTRMRIKPRALRTGETIGLCAPSGPIEADFVAAGIRELEGLGFRVLAADDLGRRTGFTAGSAERRVAEIHDLFADPDVRAIVCARGGAGALSLLPLLDPARALADPKPFVGYSDVTALHLYLGRLGLVTIHGPMAGRTLIPGRYHRESLLAALTGEGAFYASEPDDLETLRPGEGVRRVARRLPLPPGRRRGDAVGLPRPTRRGRSSSSRTCGSGPFASTGC